MAKKFIDLVRKVSSPDELLESLAKTVQESLLDGIESKVDPDGNAWAPWADSTREKRERKGNADQGLLDDTRAMKASLSREVNRKKAVIGFKEDYSRFHETGTRKMPARRIVGGGNSPLGTRIEPGFFKALDTYFGGAR